ncbi:hypothetical protein DYB26_013780, partial [Aphanomyces astaci]
MSKRNTFVSKQMQWQLGLVTLINCILLVQVTVFRAYATASETDQSNACNKFNTIRLAVRVFLWTTSSILFLPTTGFRYFKMYHVQWATGSPPQDTSGPNIVRTHYLRLCELLALVQIAALLVSTGTIVLGFVQVEWTFTCPTAMDKRIYQICMALSLLVATYCYTISWEFLLSFHKLRTHLLFQHGVFDCKTKSWQEKPFNGSTKELLRFQMWMTVKQRDIDGLRSAIAAAINEDAAFATQWYRSPSIWNQLVCVSRRNPLHMAIKTNQFNMVQLLLQGVGDIDVEGPEERRGGGAGHVRLGRHVRVRPSLEQMQHQMVVVASDCHVEGTQKRVFEPSERAIATEFALQLRQSLEDNFLTTWMDLMDPTGIGGGAVWRDEIASGIKHAAVVLCVLSETYPVSQWCMKELAFAKAHNVP